MTGFDVDSGFVAAKLCQDFVYFAGKGPFYIPHRAFMTLDGFRQFVGQHYGILYYTRIVDGVEVKDQIAAAEWWLNTRPEGKRVCSEIVFEPGVQVPLEKFNTWELLKHEMCAPHPTAQFEDIRPLVEHLLFLTDGNAEAVMWIIHWLAHLYQFPAFKIPSFVCFHSDVGGVGKSMLKQLLIPIFGESMVGSMSGHHLHGDFSDLLYGNRVVFIEEVAFENRRSTYEKFKDLVSDQVFSHNPKGRPAARVRNTMHFIVCTNRIDALPIMKDDRRALVVSCPRQPKPQSYYRDFAAWIKGPGPALVAGVLSSLDLSGFDASAAPPVTAAQRQMYEESMPALERAVRELLDDRAPPFDRDFGTPKGILDTLLIVHQSAMQNTGVSQPSLARALKAIGCAKQQMRIRKGEDPKWVWVWRNRERWLNESIENREQHLFIK